MRRSRSHARAGALRGALARLRSGAGRGDDELERELIWIFGCPRSGSTWLLNLLRAQPELLAINEPSIGLHLGPFASDVIDAPASAFTPDQLLFHRQLAGVPDYFFSDAHADAWRPLLRTLILGRIRAQVVRSGSQGGRRGVLLKEPHGSQAADLIMSVLPRARMILLVRDGRDVIDSELDASEAGSWATRKFGGGRGMTPERRLAFAEQRAHKWLARIEASERAYAALPEGQRARMRYEDLLGDTVGGVATILAALGIDADHALVEAAAARLSVDALPPARKGPGEFVRSASPGAWREHLSDAERSAIEAVIGPKLRALGYR